MLRMSSIVVRFEIEIIESNIVHFLPLASKSFFSPRKFIRIVPFKAFQTNLSIRNFSFVIIICDGTTNEKK